MTNVSLFKILHYLPKVWQRHCEVSPQGLHWAESSWVQDTSSSSILYRLHRGPLGTPGFSRLYILLPVKMGRTEPVAPCFLLCHQSPELCHSPGSVCCPKCSDSWPWWCWILLWRGPSHWLWLAEKAPNLVPLVKYIQTGKYFYSLTPFLCICLLKIYFCTK